jgi:predicted peptidase
MLTMTSCGGGGPVRPVVQRSASRSRSAGSAAHNAVAATATATPKPAADGDISCPAFPVGGSSSIDRFLTCHYQLTFEAYMTFYLYVPNGYNPRRTYPLVLILHGVDESADPGQSAAANRANVLGQDYIAVWGQGYPADGPSVQTQRPCFVLVPQAEGSSRWVNVPGDVSSYRLSKQPSQSLQMAINITKLLEQQYTSIDENRLYVTGISMGAFGVWDATLRWPTLFAAAVPVSGAGDPALANRITHLPIWDFHGADDNLIPVAGSQLMIQALRSAGGHPCYTQYPGALHVIWDQVYGLQSNLSNPLYPWLFMQSNNNRTAASYCP